MSNEHRNIKNKNKNTNTNIIAAAFILFILPIVLVIAGVFLGAYVAKLVQGSIRIYQVIGGVVGVIIAFVFIKLFDKGTVVDEEREKFYWEDM